jgi:hypothetical protein
MLEITSLFDIKTPPKAVFFAAEKQARRRGNGGGVD